MIENLRTGMDPAEKKSMQLYYFSGTGNSKHVVDWFLDEAQQKNIEAQSIDISKLPERRKIARSEAPLLGFVSPTHGFNFPPIMFHFILHFPRSRGRQKALIVNTRAGMKLGKFFLPGLSGVAQYFTALLLLFKGYKIIGMQSIDLPSNWISLHPGLRLDVIQSIFKKLENETRQFAQKILENRTSFKALFDIIQDLALTPIAFLYYLFGRYVFAKSFIASHNCTACGLCVKECPVQAIKMIDNRPYWKHTCESCMHCMNLCPHRVIETAHGFIFLVMFLANAVILVAINKLLGTERIIHNQFDGVLGNMLIFLFNTFIYFLILIGAYRILHILLRYRFFERIVVYTSLTWYQFWRRYPFKKLR